MRKPLFLCCFAAALLLAGCATNSGPPPSALVAATPQQISNEIVAWAATSSLNLRVVNATPYSIELRGPSHNFLLPMGQNEIDITLAQESQGTLVVARSYVLAPNGNALTGHAFRAENTGANHKFLQSLLDMVKQRGSRLSSD